MPRAQARVPEHVLSITHLAPLFRDVSALLSNFPSVAAEVCNTVAQFRPREITGSLRVQITFADASAAQAFLSAAESTGRVGLMQHEFRAMVATAPPITIAIDPATNSVSTSTSLACVLVTMSFQLGGTASAFLKKISSLLNPRFCASLFLWASSIRPLPCPRPAPCLFPCPSPFPDPFPRHPPFPHTTAPLRGRIPPGDYRISYHAFDRKRAGWDMSSAPFNPNHGLPADGIHIGLALQGTRKHGRDVWWPVIVSCNERHGLGFLLGSSKGSREECAHRSSKGSKQECAKRSSAVFRLMQTRLQLELARASLC